jgi:hypothetical protein
MSVGIGRTPAIADAYLVKAWRALLLVYGEIDVRLPVGGWRKRRFHHVADPEEIDDAVTSFRALPQLVEDLTSGAAGLTYDIVHVDRALDSLTRRNEHEFWPSPDDTRKELDGLARAGKRDSIFVFWPQHDFVRASSVPCNAWGLGMAASDWSNGATYAAVANAPSPAWRGEAPGEVWLHEWLHGVCGRFAREGHPMPQRDADGAELHGYVRSPTAGWTEYYRDLMTGNVIENGRPVGIPLVAWESQRRAIV